jgi:hypothetical protein
MKAALDAEIGDGFFCCFAQGISRRRIVNKPR